MQFPGHRRALAVDRRLQQGVLFTLQCKHLPVPGFARVPQGRDGQARQQRLPDDDQTLQQRPAEGRRGSDGADPNFVAELRERHQEKPTGTSSRGLGTCRSDTVRYSPTTTASMVRLTAPFGSATDNARGAAASTARTSAGTALVHTSTSACSASTAAVDHHDASPGRGRPREGSSAAARDDAVSKPRETTPHPAAATRCPRARPVRSPAAVRSRITLIAAVRRPADLRHRRAEADSRRSLRRETFDGEPHAGPRAHRSMPVWAPPSPGIPDQRVQRPKPRRCAADVLFSTQNPERAPELRMARRGPQLPSMASSGLTPAETHPCGPTRRGMQRRTHRLIRRLLRRPTSHR